MQYFPYIVHAFNARGQQLYTVEHYERSVGYVTTFAACESYDTAVWATSPANGLASGYVERFPRYASATGAPAQYVRNRIDYFEIWHGSIMLARIERYRDHLNTNRTRVIPMAGRDAQRLRCEVPDARYTVSRVPSGHGYSASVYGGLLGCFGREQDACNACWTHLADSAAQSESPAVSDAPAPESAPAPLAPGSGPYDETGNVPSSECEAPASDYFGKDFPSIPAMAHSDPCDPFNPTGPLAGTVNAIRTSAPAPELVTVPDGFTPSPYWADTEVYAVSVDRASTDACGVVVYRASDGAFLEFAECERIPGEWSATSWEMPDAALRRIGFDVAPVNRRSLEITEGEWNYYADETNWPATSGKFQNGLAERLYGDDFPDDTMGDVEGFGHFTLFRSDRAILQTDSFGFVGVTRFDTEALTQTAWDSLARDHERFCLAGMEDALPTDECDGIFLIFDTARHRNGTADRDEIIAHVIECEICSAYQGVLDSF